MKKILYLVILLHVNSLLISAIDPTRDFRTPETLQNSLQEGLCAISDILQEIATEQNKRSVDLSQVKQELSDLINKYDQTVGTTRNNSIYEGDKQYLESLIDRIDSMIGMLEENDASVDQYQDTAIQGDIDTVRSLCSDFKTKLYQH